MSRNLVSCASSSLSRAESGEVKAQRSICVFCLVSCVLAPCAWSLHVCVCVCAHLSVCRRVYANPINSLSMQAEQCSSAGKLVLLCSATHPTQCFNHHNHNHNHYHRHHYLHLNCCNEDCGDCNDHQGGQVSNEASL